MVHLSATVGYSEFTYHVSIEVRHQTTSDDASTPVSMTRLTCTSEAHARRIAREINTPVA